LLFEHKQRVATEKMSLRQAANLIPKDEKGLKQSATAAEKAAKRKAEKEADARRVVVADLSTEERIGDLAIDEFLTAKGDLDVEELVMALTTRLDKDQLLDLTTRLRSHIDKLDEEEKAAEEAEKAAAQAEQQRQFEELKARNQIGRRV